MLSNEGTVFVGLLSLGCFKYTAMYVSSRRLLIGKVARLNLYPVKSCQGVQLKKAFCTYTGLKHLDVDIWDRHFSLTDAQGRFINGGRRPRAFRVVPRIEEDKIVVSAPEMPDLIVPQIPEETEIYETRIHGDKALGYDCGDEASGWFSEFLELPGTRLLYASKNLEKRNLSTQHKDKKYKSLARSYDNVAFQDYAAYLLASETSLTDLNDKNESGDVYTMERFRPNIVITGVNKPWAEDTFRQVHINNVNFTNMKICVRCPVTCVNPETGVKDENVNLLHTLSRTRDIVKEFEGEGCFGINLFPDNEGEISVGDDVYVTVGPTLGTVA